MKNARTATLLTGFVALSAIGAASSATLPDAATSKRILTTLKERFPDVHIEGIEVSPWAGVYTIIGDGEIVYTNADASILFNGQILDTRTKENLTAKRWNELHAIDFGRLPLDLAIKIKKGAGSRQLAIFEDPECPFCQRLEGELQAVSNVTIYVFLFPLEDVHPGALQRSRDIWCSKDRGQAWTEWMTRRTPPAKATCNAEALAQLHKLGDDLRISATPTLFFSNGQRSAGFMKREDLERNLASAATARVAASPGSK